VGQLPTIGDLSHLPGSCCRFVGDVFESVDDESDFSEQARKIQPFRPSAAFISSSGYSTSTLQCVERRVAVARDPRPNAVIGFWLNPDGVRSAISSSRLCS
jgi:hypothetical protein